MKLRIVRRRKYPNFWHLERAEFLFGWSSVEIFQSLDAAVAGAAALLDGKHPMDIIEVIDDAKVRQLVAGRRAS